MDNETLPAENLTEAANGTTEATLWENLQDPEWLLEQSGGVITALVILILGWIVAGIIGRLTTRITRKAKVDETLCRFLGKLVRWMVLVLVVLVCLGSVGVDITAFAAVIAAAGFAIGLAFQGSLSNFSAGVMLLIFRPFKIGDVVSVAGHTGKVDEISVFVTTLDTPDNRRLILPNSSIFGSTIENITHHPTRRVDVAVGASYDADIDQTREVLMKAAKSVENVHDDPAPAIVLSELGGSSVDWVVRVWTDAGNFWPVKDALTRAVKYALDEANIGIPYPQMDVHLDQSASG